MIVLFSASFGQTDIVLLKNGKTFENVTVWKDKNRICFENNKTIFYFNPEEIETIIRTKENDNEITTSWLGKQLTKLVSLKFSVSIFGYNHNIYIGIILCGLICFIVFLIFYRFLWETIKQYFKNMKMRKGILYYVNSLDESEKAVLREFEVQNLNTIELPSNDPVVAGLIHKGIIKSIRNYNKYSIKGTLLPTIITESAKRYITREILNIPIDKTFEEQREFMNQDRPKFIDEVDNYWNGLDLDDLSLKK